jgi:tripartite-type tricarboxylate transporter receptor subunit TctC
MIETAPAAQPLIKAGKLRALATATAQPVASLPGVPTAAQAGLQFEVSSMFGLMAPAGTPAPVVQRVNAALKLILGQPEVVDSMLAQGTSATYTTPQDAGLAIRAEAAKWTKVVRDGNIKPE